MFPLVDAAWLREHLGDPGLRVVDCRFVLGEPGAGRPAWLRGHVPGATHLDVDADLAGEPGERGRHPLPEPAAFEAAARRAGIGPARPSWPTTRRARAAPPGSGGSCATSATTNAAVLDGGLGAWREAGGRLEAGEPQVAPGDFEARPRAGDTVDAEAAATAPLLLDARAPERYRGESEPIDPVAGHIPGAVNAPAAELAPGGRFREPAELRRLLGGAGGEAVAYCGSGVTACTVVLAAELAGLGPVRLYPGSWSEWCRAGRPVERSRSD